MGRASKYRASEVRPSKSRPSKSRGWILGGLILLSALGAWAPLALAQGDASRLYVAGRRAVLDQRWHEAVLYLSAAVDRQEEEGREVLIYGKHLEPYLPHFYLGVAFFELGELRTAFEAWNESERQGHLARVDGKRYRSLGRLLERYGWRLAASRALDRAEAGLAVFDLEGLDLEAPIDLERPELTAEHELLKAEREALAERMTRLRLGLAAASGTASGPASDFESGTEIGTEALALLDRIAGLRERFETLRSDLERAARDRLLAGLRRERCSATAVDALLVGSAGAWPEPPESRELAAGALARAVLEPCGRSQQVLLALAEPSALAGDGPELLAVRLRQGLGSSGTDGSAPLSETVGQGSCDRKRMAALARQAERRILADGSSSHSPSDLPSDPLAALVRAHGTCGEPELAAIYSEEILEVPPPPPSAALAKRTEPTTDGFGSEARAERWAEATLLADAGVCDRTLVQRFAAWSDADGADESRVRSTGIPFDPALYLTKMHRNCGDLRAVAASLSRDAEDRVSREGNAVQRASLESWYRSRAAADFYLDRRALIFAAEDYGDGRLGWSDLPGARRDAEAVRAALLDHGFDEARMVIDPRSRTVRREMRAMIENQGPDPEGRRLLLVYWAGHGASLHGNYGGRTWSTGFLVPVDAPYPHQVLDPRSEFVDKAVSMDALEGWAREIRSRHALFLLDSCYSGSAFRAFANTRKDRAPRSLLGAVESEAPAWDPFSRLRQPVRLVVTSSAADQQAADSSFFRRSLVELLDRPSAADYRRDQIVSGSELCFHLESTTRHASGGRQSPQCQRLPAPFDRGDVVFAASPEPTAVATRLGRWARLRFLSDLATWRAAAEKGDRAALEDYLDHFPEGRFATLARQRLGSSPIPPEPPSMPSGEGF